MITRLWTRRPDLPAALSVADVTAPVPRPGWQALRLRLEVAQWRFGAGWSVMALVFAGLAAYAAALAGHAAGEEERLQRLTANVTRLEAAAAAASAASADGRPTSSPVEGDATVRVAALRQTLGDPRETTATLIRLYQLAEARQLAVRQAEFSQARPRAGIGRLQVVMPIKGGYPQLRGFIDDALRAFPHLSLDRVTFKRNQVGQEQLESALHLSLWLREGRDDGDDTVDRQGARFRVDAPGQGGSR